MSDNDRTDGVVGCCDDNQKKEETGNGFGAKLRKEKRVSGFRFRKKKKGSNLSSPACNLGNFCCFKQTPTLDSPAVESPTSDPNSPEFTHVLLRDLIEKNDFYAKECNPHLRIDCTDDH